MDTPERAESNMPLIGTNYTDVFMSAREGAVVIFDTPCQGVITAKLADCRQIKFWQLDYLIFCPELASIMFVLLESMVAHQKIYLQSQTCATDHQASPC